jgi:1,4-dihydroxy-2-naphthoyl-CoA synthase
MTTQYCDAWRLGSQPAYLAVFAMTKIIRLLAVPIVAVVKGYAGLDNRCGERFGGDDV